MEILYIIAIILLLLIVVILSIVIYRVVNNAAYEIEQEVSKKNEINIYLQDLKTILNTIKKKDLLYQDDLIKSLHKQVFKVSDLLDKYFKENGQ